MLICAAIQGAMCFSIKEWKTAIKKKRPTISISYCTFGGNNGFFLIENLKLFKIELYSGTPHEKTWNIFIFLVPEPSFGNLPSGKCHNRPRPNYLPANNVESRSSSMPCMLSLSRRLPMRWHCSVTAIKNLRRFPTCCHCHCQGCCTAKLTEIADAPILQSCHSHWGGRCTFLPSQSCRCQEFKEIADAPSSSLLRRLRRKIEGDCWCANIAVSPLLLRRFPHRSLAAIRHVLCTVT